MGLVSGVLLRIAYACTDCHAQANRYTYAYSASFES
jgi:hypothetical protein